ncbi:solute carrier family 41 member 1 [Suillus bovinus]|uniref:solute carrier family 41 member 1 n=1 Tax=Suillus bovinus TaxID=48563 RepID=UPI001B872ACA|nr:solute carrier family 41 member 1 [Suillus bovinus]KAG2132842.1 solute carrier family 41 member 1 [Suillus bovinus]
MQEDPGNETESFLQHIDDKDSDDVELDVLQDILVTPRATYRTAGYDPQDFDDDAEHIDDGSDALLGSGGRTRGNERIPSGAGRVWSQIGSIVVECAPTLLMTTISLLFTGELLDRVSRWRAMSTIDELIMIIPVVLNLKGNLEMNLSARMGTAANMGGLDDRSAQRKIVGGNMALLQVQAIVVAFVAACVSMLLGLLVPELSSGPVDPFPQNSTLSLIVRVPRPTPPSGGKPKSGLIEFTMVAASAMMSTCLSSITLGSFMCFLVIMCRRYGRDPDNIAPPIASCLGDLVTLSIFGIISSILINVVNTPIPLICVILTILSATLCVFLVRRNSSVKDLIYQGWVPLFGAMVISCATGIVLDMFASRYQGFPLLAIAISGLPGSVGSIFISRLSTALHATSANTCLHKSGPSSKLVMVTLTVITIPIEILFLCTLRAFGWLKLPIIFAVFSVLFFCCAVVTSLVIARWLTDFLWSKGLDPDTYALPIHSALMDLIGQLLLVLCFEIVSLLGMNL